MENAHGICTGFERDLNGNGRTVERPVYGKFFFTRTVHCVAYMYVPPSLGFQAFPVMPFLIASVNCAAVRGGGKNVCPALTQNGVTGKAWNRGYVPP